MSVGSANHKLLSELIGDNWKEIARVGYPLVNSCARGYVHEEYMPAMFDKLEKIKSSNNDKIDITIS